MSVDDRQNTGVVEVPRAHRPNWTEFPKYPVVALTAVLAVGITVAWWAKVDISPLFQNAEIRRGQLWRLLTSIFPHIDFFHLVFNVYWLWIFGTAVERVFGHVKIAGLFVLLALGSNSLDFAFAQGGVGLSGVGYGLFGLLWILSKWDARFRDAINSRTVALFVVWFFLCIFATATHVWNVANVAHGAGALVGVMVGLAIAFPQRRQLAIVSISALVLFGLCAATFARPRLNLSKTAGYEEETWGYDDLVADRNQDALRWLRDAVEYQPKVAGFWFNLGLAYSRLGDPSSAAAAYARAHQLDPDDPAFILPAAKTN
jgi:membrane associated rhomboid family serine protease